MRAIMAHRLAEYPEDHTEQNKLRGDVTGINRCEHKTPSRE
jgi:hypothetical protein